MKNKPQFKKIAYVITSYSLILVFWQVLTLHFSPLVVPPIGSVLQSMGKILLDSSLHEMIWVTTVRLMIGLSIGVGLGGIIGIAMGKYPLCKGILSPIIELFQTVPPVSWVVLALVWFGFNGKPAIFIVIISTIPVIAINVCEGISNIDYKLLQMAQLYQFSKKKTFLHVIFPSITPYFSSAFRIALGGGWKIAVMGEVLTTSDGIGGMIKLARLNIEPENIIAWSIVIVMLFHISDVLLKFVFRGKGRTTC